MADWSGLAEPESVEDGLLRRLDPARLPRHVAIIMDGNGRWARRRHLPRVAGHRAGIEAVRDSVETSARLGLEVLTLYAFSQENWKRPRAEVEFLMELLREYTKKELRTLLRNNVRFRVLGRMHELAPSVQADLRETIASTEGNSGLIFNIALSYGGRGEIVDAVRALVRDGVPAESIDEAALARRLYTADLPDPDLLIRTSGEMRVSNFLLWQIAYAELWVTPVLWPDFRRRHLFEALEYYQRRERRFGGVDPATGQPSPVFARR